ncbi:hypothetical protein ANANG_G00173570 [Anguilla anguilla]|uniref:Uncharacterized protein n=1 Tax=Anguilla anguilla TaxID=7936 RepID=A0A9D3RWL8_ANGAN|nr:hypothetical protein ANANG_G00173570 [Anguilla anguilla]
MIARVWRERATGAGHCVQTALRMTRVPGHGKVIGYTLSSHRFSLSYAQSSPICGAKCGVHGNASELLGHSCEKETFSCTALKKIEYICHESFTPHSLAKHLRLFLQLVCFAVN